MRVFVRKRFAYGVAVNRGLSQGLETFYDGSWWLVVGPVCFWRHLA